MKKIFGLIFVFALAFSLASCGECEHVDNNVDGYCDECEEYIGLSTPSDVCSHVDEDANGKCDKCTCNMPVITNGTDWANAFNIPNAKIAIDEKVLYSGTLYPNYAVELYAFENHLFDKDGIGVAEVTEYLSPYLAFGNSFDSFSYDAISGSFKCAEITIDLYDYYNVVAVFDEHKNLTSLSFEVTDYYYTYIITLTISNHGTTVKPERDPFVVKGEEYCEYLTTRDVTGHDLAYITMTIKDYGEIKLLLDATTAPETVKNFLKLINEGFYDGLTFHRVIDEFMIQGGDPNADGSGDYKDASGNKVTIKGEFSNNNHENDIKHIRGVISMARGSDKNSASCQFFICNATADWLDGDYAAFGYVIDGMSVVDRITYDTCIYGNSSNGTIADKTKQAVIESIVIDELVGISMDDIIGPEDELPEDSGTDDPGEPAE